MCVNWQWLAPLLALIITLIAMQTAVVLTGAIRTRNYRRFENKNKAAIARQFSLPPGIPSSQAEERRRALSPFVTASHQTANAAQTVYHNAVARSVGSLVIAFIGLVLGDIPPQDWPAIGGLAAQHAQIEYLLNWLDCIAMLSVLVLFLYAHKASGRWIAVRSGTELLRQYQIFYLVLPGADATADNARSKFDREADIVKTEVQNGSTTDIISRIERFWQSRRTFIENRPLEDADVTPDAVVSYLERRARRQLGWFSNSKARLEHSAERHSGMLLVLYVIAASFALLKLALFLCSGSTSAYLLALLLILTGLSGAMTAYYINQNARSLIHRYNTQQRRIGDWLKAFNKKFPNLPSLTLDAEDKADIRERILQFEDLMIEELIDWVHITSHDAMELAP